MTDPLKNDDKVLSGNIEKILQVNAVTSKALDSIAITSKATGNTVKIWLKVFIPRNISGYTKTVPSGIHAGKTMIPGPTPASDCFLTDNRDFDSNIAAPARMHSEIKIDVTNETPTIINQFHFCGQTHEINCKIGEEECSQTASNSGMRFFNLRGSRSSSINIDLEGAANNPCAIGSPYIDYKGTLTINISTRSVAFDGLIEPFPAFEMYATANDGSGNPLFRIGPLPDTTPWNLFGGATRTARGSTTI